MSSEGFYGLHPASVVSTVAAPSAVRSIAADVLGDDGRLRVLPAEYWASTTVGERAYFGHLYGIYSFPTMELVEHLQAIIAGRPAIEIGAGHGVLAEVLGIPATDSFQQEQEPYRSYYDRIGQPRVRYGPNVVRCEAASAVRRYRPKVVIACWVTELYDPRRHEVGGNEAGVDEADVIRHCDEYVLVGNERVHSRKAIMSRPHDIEYPPFVYSRAANGTRDFIAIWRRGAR